MSIVKNYIYNTVYQIMMLLIPLITMPYITRIFTKDQIGVQVYTLTIVTYFMLFGMLGMQLYANRQVAYIRDNKDVLTKTFWSLYATQIVTCLISLVLYYLYVGFLVNNYVMIYIIQGLNILCVLLDVSWLFMGLEDFKKVVIRNTIVKLVGLGAIFIFVRSSEDLLLYIILTILVNILGMISMWFYVPKYVGKISVDFKIVKSTIKPLLKLFLPQIATQVYLLLSKTMIGALSSTAEVALYEYSQKIVRMILALITSIGVVLMPRVSNIIAKGRHDEVAKIIEKTFKFVSYIAMPMAIGLMCISQILVSWFFGEDFKEAGILTSVSSVIIIAVSWANIIGIQYLIAIKQENKYTVSILISAGVNLLMNAILIKAYGALGAVISLVVAEFVGVIIQFFLVRKELNVKNMLLGVVKYFVAAIIMGIIIIPIGIIIKNGIIANIIQATLGAIVYGLIMFIIKDEVQKEIFNGIISIVKKKAL
ncbi:flippase [Clostridium gasigenes]|uniref:flippase n=1 Tax=Clostridium gasigenes TaxID=94869 RepID=UPI001C0CC07F|nr:flippase [Clostridium gasigenes]MBU3108883.1 flippase [Clostridium gasigenes]